MKGHAALTSSKNHNIMTPPEIYNPLNAEYNFTLDACTTPDNPLKTPKFYTEAEDGLKQPWETWTFVNPPFKHTQLWIAKALSERDNNGVSSVMLLASRTGVSWFHEQLYDKTTWRFRPGIEVRFLQGRPQFIDPETRQKMSHGSTFDVMVAILRPVERIRIRL